MLCNCSAFAPRAPSPLSISLPVACAAAQSPRLSRARQLDGGMCHVPKRALGALQHRALSAQKRPWGCTYPHLQRHSAPDPSDAGPPIRKSAERHERPKDSGQYLYSNNSHPGPCGRCGRPGSMPCDGEEQKSSRMSNRFLTVDQAI
jgi:hypothetical protein